LDKTNSAVCREQAGSRQKAAACIRFDPRSGRRMPWLVSSQRLSGKENRQPGFKGGSAALHLTFGPMPSTLIILKHFFLSFPYTE
jgi:hypothetical protein